MKQEMFARYIHLTTLPYLLELSLGSSTRTTLGRKNKCLVSWTGGTISRNSTSYTVISNPNVGHMWTLYRPLRYPLMLYGWNPDSDEEQIPAHADFLHS